MIETWLSLLAGLPLSRSERDVVARFSADPEGRIFLSVSEVLRSHKLVAEGLELLSEGVARHPEFTVARVVLARELYNRGSIEEGWRTLEDSVRSLKDNLLAQKLRLKMALLLGHDSIARTTVQNLKQAHQLDEESKKHLQLFEVSGPAALKEFLLLEFKAHGVEPELGALQVAQPPQLKGLAVTSPGENHSLQGAPSQRESVVSISDHINKVVKKPKNLDRRSLEVMVSDFFDAEDVTKDDAIKGFHVVPINEIFNPNSGTSPVNATLESHLDSTTLADIYAKQGHYSKALGVYRRLLRASPGHELLKRKVVEMSRLEREQKERDIEVDPAMVDRMESVEIIDRQIKFYNTLLSRLG